MGWPLSLVFLLSYTQAVLRSCPNGSWILESLGSVGTGLSHCGVRCLTGVAGPLQPQSGGARGWLCAVRTLSPAWPSQHVWQRGERRQLETITGGKPQGGGRSQKFRDPSEEHPFLACQPGGGQLWPRGGLWPDSSGHASLFPLGVLPPEQSSSVFAELSLGKPGLPPACSSVGLLLPVWEPLSEGAGMCILLLWSHDHELCWEEEVRWRHPPP